MYKKLNALFIKTLFKYIDFGTNITYKMLLINGKILNRLTKSI